jgi:hypothetical protein
MPGNFLDTNVLVYIASVDPEKAARDEAFVAAGGAAQWRAAAGSAASLRVSPSCGAVPKT